MKRPLVWCCMIFLIFFLAMQAAEETDADLLLLQTEKILEERVGENSPVRVSGFVAECSTLSSGVRLFMDHLTIISEDNSELSFLPETRLTFITEQRELRPGDFVRVSGYCTLFSDATNPGQFDERAYYFTKNTVCRMNEAQILEYRCGSWNLDGFLYRIRNAWMRSFKNVLDEQTAGTIAAIVLGEKAAMDAGWKKLFQEGGIAHILAVSGLHITLVGTGLYRLLRKAGLLIPAAAAGSAVVVWLYALMTGFGISAVRAAVMFLIWLGAQIGGRKYDGITAAAAAAVLIVGNDAAAIRQASFLLSFSAVLSMAVLLPAAERACGITSVPGRQIFSCLIVWMGTLPVTLYFFYQTAPWSILVNLAVIPLMTVVMCAGMGAAAAGLLWGALGRFLAAPVYYLLHLFEWLCRMEKKLPLSIWVAGRPSWRRIAVYYGILAALVTVSCAAQHLKKRRQKKKWPGRILWLGALASCVVLMLPSPNQDLQITCIDVGQGDAALIRLPGGECALIDGGSTSVDRVWEYRIEDVVKIGGTDTLDYIFLSHADQDHISGVKELLQNYERGFGEKNAGGITLKNLVLPPTADESDFVELKELAGINGIEVLIMQAGAYIQSRSGVRISCLAPDPSLLTGDKNEDSMVLLLEYGAFRMLFTGDLEGTAERSLAEEGTELYADVLKVGHHGSGNSSSEVFLQAVSPKAAVISCGENNSYGHPADETLQRLGAMGCRIWQTPVHGAVTIRSDGTAFSVKPYFSPEKD